MDLKQTIQSALTLLQSLLPVIDELSSLKTAQDTAKASLDSMKAEITKVDAELRNKTAGLTAAQIQNLKDLENSIQGKRQELVMVTGQAEQATGKRDELAGAVRALQEKHDQLEASFASLKKRFA
jgi:chromosome segregation ATPase